MSGIFDAFGSLLDFIQMIITFPIWLISNIPAAVGVLRVAVTALPDFLYPIALLSISLIVVMAFVKIL